jgi:hypothetical protein
VPKSRDYDGDFGIMARSVNDDHVDDDGDDDRWLTALQTRTEIIVGVTMVVVHVTVVTAGRSIDVEDCFPRTRTLRKNLKVIKGVDVMTRRKGNRPSGKLMKGQMIKMFYPRIQWLAG